MQSTPTTLPTDTLALQSMVQDLREENASLKLLVSKLQRHQFGKRSEKFSENSLQLLLSFITSKEEKATTDKVVELAEFRKEKPSRNLLPEHLPRDIQQHQPPTNRCVSCGGLLNCAGEDVSEVLEYIPASFKVVRHVRPKLSCKCCNKIVQASAPERPIERGLAGAGLLAHVMIAKYCDHLPLYRQSGIYQREGVDISRSTLADWVRGTSQLLQPLVDAIKRHTISGASIHADDTPVPVLSPGRGKTKTGRLWTYVRNEGWSTDETPPSVWFAYSPDRKGIHPQSHLANFKGLIHADGYAGFNDLYRCKDREEIACWAHLRRKFYDYYVANNSPLAAHALLTIKRLYKIESAIRGKPPDVRRAIRQIQSKPIIAEFRSWLESTLATLSRGSDLARAIRYGLARWSALNHYCDDGRAEIDNNAAERALRSVTLGRKNYLFMGSDKGGERAANFYSLIGTAKMNGLDPFTYLQGVIARIATYPINRIDDLLPWNFCADQ